MGELDKELMFFIIIRMMVNYQEATCASERSMTSSGSLLETARFSYQNE
jgi:hypothetical protein